MNEKDIVLRIHDIGGVVMNCIEIVFYWKYFIEKFSRWRICEYSASDDSGWCEFIVNVLIIVGSNWIFSYRL